MPSLRMLRHCRWIGLSAGLWAAWAWGAASVAQAGGAVASTLEVKLLDVGLVDQAGVQRAFRTDVIGDRIAVLNFVYTGCKTSCPMASAVFEQVQEHLAASLGGDVVLVSLSIDPVTDRPWRLRAAADQFHAKPGWSWLTGEKAAMDRVLHGLGVYLSSMTDHPAMVMIGDGRKGEWVRLFGFPEPDEILSHVERFQSARRPAAAGSPRYAPGPGSQQRREE